MVRFHLPGFAKFFFRACILTLPSTCYFFHVKLKKTLDKYIPILLYSAPSIHRHKLNPNNKELAMTVKRVILLGVWIAFGYLAIVMFSGMLQHLASL
jgi:hypothetical protein